MVPNTCESPTKSWWGVQGKGIVRSGSKQKPLNSKCVAPSIIHHKFVFKLPELTIFCQTCVIRPQDSGVSCAPYDRFPGCTQIIPGEPLPVIGLVSSQLTKKLPAGCNCFFSGFFVVATPSC